MTQEDYSFELHDRALKLNAIFNKYPNLSGLNRKRLLGYEQRHSLEATERMAKIYLSMQKVGEPEKTSHRTGIRQSTLRVDRPVVYSRASSRTHVIRF